MTSVNSLDCSHLSFARVPTDEQLIANIDGWKGVIGFNVVHRCNEDVLPRLRMVDVHQEGMHLVQEL